MYVPKEWEQQYLLSHDMVLISLSSSVNICFSIKNAHYSKRMDLKSDGVWA